VGVPNSPINEAARPKNAVREIDGSHMYVLPGFIDLHAHISWPTHEVPAEYVYKLWLAHGVTSVREAGSGNGADWTLKERDRSAKNEIVAPRIFPYAYTAGDMWDGGDLSTPEQARKFAQWAARRGFDGLKVIGADAYEPETFAALMDEAKKLKLGSTIHLAQIGVPRLTIIKAARMGLRGMEHWYGLPESMLANGTVQDFPAEHNFHDEQARFGDAGRLWKQTAPGSAKWNATLDELLALDFTIDPTLTIYEANRDVMRVMNAEWHARYTLPALWQWFQPSRNAHGSYFFNWTTKDEIEWKNNYRIWMQFVNDYKNRGGRVGTGSDSGFIFKLYGFEYVRELELLQEAGFHPLEVIRAATLSGAEVLHEGKAKRLELGMLKPGFLADLVIVEENPLADFKVLYGTGTLRLDPSGEVRRAGGVRWVIKDGIVYDAKKLLADVERMVSEAKAKK
ncbi:MAG TPA: amidohydrolase family protein, partial [Thermoanaerobaculia bacterium]